MTTIPSFTTMNKALAILLTLGLFFFVINGAMLFLASLVLSGLTIDGCLPALLGGLVLALANWVVGALDKSHRKKKK